MAKPLKLLVTGFGPFPGIHVNPTDRLARLLARSGRFRRMGIAIEAHVFPTRWATVARDLPDVLKTTKPDAVLHLGVAGRRRKISVEMFARPSPSAISPDAGGKSAAPASRKGAALLRRIAAPAAPLLNALEKAGSASHLSHTAGRYLCNAIYHQSLSLRAEARDKRPTVFIHVPMPGPARASLPLSRVRSRKPGERATLKGLEEALLVLARAARSAQNG
ncbi:peptidase C15 [Terrarubrum flagellatum]|uniref:pyroglutamyl-peptidase I family protein n=1 Tax=Terrirubrum flagellatum TaxID=2895980 RepID=UPI003144F180